MGWNFLKTKLLGPLTFSDLKKSNAGIMINIFQIFHTFSEQLVAGWALISDWLTHFLTTGAPAQGSWSTIFNSFILSANHWSLVEIWFLTGWHTFWLLGLQRKDHNQAFSNPSFFQWKIGCWLRFDRGTPPNIFSIKMITNNQATHFY